MIYEFSFVGAVDGMKVTLDLREIIAVVDAGTEVDDGCKVFLRGCGDHPFRLKETREEVVRVWTAAPPEMAEAPLAIGVYDFGPAEQKPAVFDDPIRDAALTEEAQIAEANRILDEQEDEDLEDSKLRNDEDRAAWKAWEEIVFPIVEAANGLALLERRRHVAAAFTDEVQAKLAGIKTPPRLYNYRHAAYPPSLHGAYGAPPLSWQDGKGFLLQLVYGFYMPCDFDVENIDPGERSSIREAHAAISVVTDANTEWVCQKVQRAVEEIDYYFGRDNYGRSDELLSFLEEHDALEWDKNVGRPGSPRWLRRWGPQP